MKLYLIRHGESEGNVRRLLYGWSDLPLTERGRAQAAELSEKMRGLHIDRCLSSSLSRAAETAQISLGPLGVDIAYYDELREQHMGEFENEPFEKMLAERPEVLALGSGWTGVCPPGGESFGQMRERVLSCLYPALEQGEELAVVAHNGPLCAIIASLLGMDDRSANCLMLHHGCYSSLEYTRGHWLLEYFNK